MRAEYFHEVLLTRSGHVASLCWLVGHGWGRRHVSLTTGHNTKKEQSERTFGSPEIINMLYYYYPLVSSSINSVSILYCCTRLSSSYWIWLLSNHANSTVILLRCNLGYSANSSMILYIGVCLHVYNYFTRWKLSSCIPVYITTSYASLWLCNQTTHITRVSSWVCSNADCTPSMITRPVIRAPWRIPHTSPYELHVLLAWLLENLQNFHTILLIPELNIETRNFGS